MTLSSCLYIPFHSSFLAALLTVAEEFDLNEEIYSLPAAVLSITRLSNVSDQNKAAAFS